MGEGGKKSKTNVTGRNDAPRDPRPKMELRFDYIPGTMKLRKQWVPINRDALHG